jgi:hypothetical protein
MTDISNKIEIAAVSYINTWPFIHGIESAEILSSVNLQLNVPSVCAQLFK